MRPRLVGEDGLLLTQYRGIVGNVTKPKVFAGQGTALVEVGVSYLQREGGHLEVRLPIFGSLTRVAISKEATEQPRVKVVRSGRVDFAQIRRARIVNDRRKSTTEKIASTTTGFGGGGSGRTGRSDFVCANADSQRYCEAMNSCLDLESPCQNDTYGSWELSQYFEGEGRLVEVDLELLRFYPDFLTVVARGRRGQARLFDDEKVIMARRADFEIQIQTNF